MAAKGLPKIAAIPAVAPAASNTFRSLSVTLEAWPMNDPKAPPVEIIGPSAPNGPPVPMEIAADRGFRMVTRGGILLRLVRICSMASRSAEHTSELQSLMRTSYAVFCLTTQNKRDQI